MSQQPLVAVVMPAHDSEAYLEEALDSVLGQTYESTYRPAGEA